jgi:dTDP-L-rhamnose 4-epimerase
LLLERGCQVSVLDSLEPPVRQRREKPSYLPNDVKFTMGEVRSRGDMGKALWGAEAVFHLAAYRDYLTGFSRLAFVNDGGTTLLYEVIGSEDLPVEKVIPGNSQAIYGERKLEASGPRLGAPDSPGRYCSGVQRVGKGSA